MIGENDSYDINAFFIFKKGTLFNIKATLCKILHFGAPTVINKESCTRTTATVKNQQVDNFSNTAKLMPNNTRKRYSKKVRLASVWHPFSSFS